uniref:Yippee like 4 n=1 Tax=Chelonoidis abingdonii TaxID=106734 RepID=A0A8C0J6J9_CHEAB
MCCSFKYAALLSRSAVTSLLVQTQQQLPGSSAPCPTPEPCHVPSPCSVEMGYIVGGGGCDVPPPLLLFAQQAGGFQEQLARGSNPRQRAGAAQQWGEGHLKCVALDRLLGDCTAERELSPTGAGLWACGGGSETVTLSHPAPLSGARVNVGCGPAEQRLLLTGLHSVADIFCESCKTTLGWKYEQAFETSQKYKEGKFIIEMSHMVKDNGWN